MNDFMLILESASRARASAGDKFSSTRTFTLLETFFKVHRVAHYTRWYFEEVCDAARRPFGSYRIRKRRGGNPKVCGYWLSKCTRRINGNTCFPVERAPPGYRSIVDIQVFEAALDDLPENILMLFQIQQFIASDLFKLSRKIVRPSVRKYLVENGRESSTHSRA